MLRYKIAPQRRLYVNTELAGVVAIAPTTMEEKGLLANASIITLEQMTLLVTCATAMRIIAISNAIREMLRTVNM